MYSVDYIINGELSSKTKRFSSLKAAYRYISSLLNTYSIQIQEEYDGIHGHELVSDNDNRFFIKSLSN